MKSAFIKIVPILWLLGASYISIAQGANNQYNLGFTGTTLANSNVAFDSNIVINTNLVNYGTQAVERNFLLFVLEVNPFPDSSAITYDFFGFGVIASNDFYPYTSYSFGPVDSVFPYPIPNGINSLGAGDTLPLSIIIRTNAGPTPFRAGPNGLVIWPAVYTGPDTSTHPQYDTIMHQNLIYQQVNVTIPTGINEPATSQTRAWVNNQTLYIINDGAAEKVNELKIYDLTGREIYGTNQSWPYQIPTSGWAAGIYAAELRLEDGGRITFKIYNH